MTETITNNIEEIIKMTEETPNDQLLGEKIRAYVWRLKETR
jgi:hypothetical protein